MLSQIVKIFPDPVPEYLNFRGNKRYRLTGIEKTVFRIAVPVIGRDGVMKKMQILLTNRKKAGPTRSLPEYNSCRDPNTE
ncbi:hypothetical protein FY557_13775 [Chryseobacterium sp. SN22]|uniref:hypothetical protein n=1 Tax=Chryseobacterium sp. SN22 TaxID=2606431 RepID=UPI0011ECCF1A|nr:hypothetical protein [Chryseobacterium sp. SN22]KAA0127235.1 hypothetical protein FY557_13775 [Chryseobacterium sp. SN22]